MSNQKTDASKAYKIKRNQRRKLRRRMEGEGYLEEKREGVSVWTDVDGKEWKKKGDILLANKGYIWEYMSFLGKQDLEGVGYDGRGFAVEESMEGGGLKGFKLGMRFLDGMAVMMAEEMGCTCESRRCNLRDCAVSRHRLASLFWEVYQEIQKGEADIERVMMDLAETYGIKNMKEIISRVAKGVGKDRWEIIIRLIKQASLKQRERELGS
jgi:hypothetical protein